MASPGGKERVVSKKQFSPTGLEIVSINFGGVDENSPRLYPEKISIFSGFLFFLKKDLF